MQTNKETTSEPPDTDNTENNELQLNHINCESTDTESDTENDYEPIIYEQPFSSHINENQLELLHNYYTRPVNNNTRTTQEQTKLIL